MARPDSVGNQNLSFASCHLEFPDARPARLTLLKRRSMVDRNSKSPRVSYSSRQVLAWARSPKRWRRKGFTDGRAFATERGSAEVLSPDSPPPETAGNGELTGGRPARRNGPRPCPVQPDKVPHIHGMHCSYRSCRAALEAKSGERVGHSVSDALGDVRRTVKFEAVPRAASTDAQAAAMGAVEGRSSATAPVSGLPNLHLYARLCRRTADGLLRFRPGSR